MAGTIAEDYGMSLRSSATEAMMNEQRCMPGDSIAEWRSSEQVEYGTASTPPPYWDTDDDDCGPKPADLYGRFTWKIENFSTINKRELRSNAFEVGGYKWCILIYPQGCDVCNHLSLFLCVANHNKLLPGWSHFAQFTIAVVNKDPKKSKYSDTLHRFWKKEHDWGWKKFMELSKMYDGFIVADTLVIKAQVQVIREKADRPFQCLDYQYKRALVRVYLSNVEQICQCFLEEKIGELSKLVLDKVRWTSFHAFWLGIDPNARRHVSRDKRDTILKVVVKHFFIEKEVTSTLVMDSLYSGLKALEFESKSMKEQAKLVEIEELPAPMIHIDQDFFVLADDVIVLIQRVVSDSLSHQPLPSKDYKCSQNQTKDGSSGDEFNNDSIERDERRLMELGRRTIEIFSLVHIFSSRIEVSYQEAVALKRQEELIREEEAAGQAESDLKSKRGPPEKEKRAKKKQAKQKGNGRKYKDRGKDERCNPMHEILQQEAPTGRISGNCCAEQAELVAGKSDALEDVSDVTDIGDDISDLLQPDLDDRDSSTTNWHTDMSEIHLSTEASGTDVQNGQIEKRSQSVMDDSSSTCSADSVPSALVSGSYKGSTSPKNNGAQTSPDRGKNRRKEEKADHIGLTNGGHNIQSETTFTSDQSQYVTGSKAALESEANGFSLKSEMRPPEKNVVEKEEAAAPQKKLPFKDQVDADRRSSPPSLGKKIATILQQPKQSLVTTVSLTISTTAVEPASSKEQPSNRVSKTGKVTAVASRLPPVTSSVQSEAQKQIIPMKTSSPHEANSSSAPIIPAPRATAPIVSTVQAVPILSRSASAAGRLDTDASSSAPSPSAPCYVPQSYRNAIIGKPVNAARGSVSIDNAASPAPRVAYSQSPSISLSSASLLPPRIMKDHTSSQPGLTFGCFKPEAVHSQSLRRDDSYHESSSATSSSSSGSRRFGLLDNMEKLDFHGKLRKQQFGTEIASGVTPYVQGTVTEEFPHLHFINDLLDDDQHIGQTARGAHHAFDRQYSLPANLSAADMGALGSSGRFDRSELCYEVGFRRGYGAPGNPLQGPRDGHFQQLDLSAYANSRLDGLLRNNWPSPFGNTGLAMLSLGDADTHGYYGYQLQDYYMDGYLYRRPNEP